MRCREVEEGLGCGALPGVYGRGMPGWWARGPPYGLAATSGQPRSPLNRFDALLLRWRLHRLLDSLLLGAP